MNDFLANTMKSYNDKLFYTRSVHGIFDGIKFLSRKTSILEKQFKDFKDKCS